MSMHIETANETFDEPSPIQTALLVAEEGTPRKKALGILADTESLRVFLKLHGDLAVALHGGELTYSDPIDKVLDSQTDDTDTTDSSDTLTPEKPAILFDYTRFIAERRTYAENQAKLDFGDPDNAQLDVTPEQRGEITRVIDAKVKEYLYQNFDEEFTSLVAQLSRGRDIDIQMSPSELFVAMEQKHMWLDRLREYVSYTRQENRIRFVPKQPTDILQDQADSAIIKTDGLDARLI